MGSDLEQLYTASYRRIVRQVAALTQDMAEAEDVVQEAFSRAMGKWTTLVRYDDPEAWVRVVAMNLARSRFRRAIRSRALLRRLEPSLTHSPPPNPDRVAVVSALRILPASQREALVLYHLADLDYRRDLPAGRSAVQHGQVSPRSRPGCSRGSPRRRRPADRYELRSQTMTRTDVERALGLIHDDLDARAAETSLPPFSAIGRRHSRHRRRRLACTGLALGAVAVGGVIAFATPGDVGRGPGPISSVQVATPDGTTRPSPTVQASVDPRLGPPSIPPASDPYVVVAAGNYLVWTDTRTGHRGHLPGTGDSKISFPAVSANGRRLVYLESTASSTAVAVLDLTTQTETTMRAADVGAVSAPSINADGTIVSWAEQTSHASGIVEAPFAHQVGYTTLLPDVSSASFDRQGGLVYIPSDTSSCALDRRSRAGTTTCLLTATSRDAVTTPNGGRWIVADPHPSPTSDQVAVTVLEASPGARAPLEALAVVRAGALHVLAHSAVHSDHETVNQPALRNQDAQLLYVDTDVPVEGQAGPGSVYAVSTSDGAQRNLISDGGATGFAYAGP